MAWLSMAQPLPITYKKQQMGMQSPLLGVVLHTTNHSAGAETLERFQSDWQAAQQQSAHFAVDRSGRLGQYRSTDDVAWHINAKSTRYIGVEHISKLDGALTTEQIEASGQLLAYFHDKLDVPLELIGSPGDRGVGVHVMFAGTWCGRKVFWQGSSRGTGQFGEILEVAESYAKWGLYQTGERNMP